MISADMSDQAILNEIGSRISRYRLNKNMTQKQLANEAGVSTPTIHRTENGSSIQLLKLLQILHALNLIDNLELFIPDIATSPLQQLSMKGKTRHRASHSEKNPNETNWTWGDEK